MSKSVTQPNTQSVDALYQGIKQLVDGVRSQVLTYWHIGKTIKTQVLQSERATYGAGVLKQLALRLTQDYGSGFSHSGLTRMAKFFEALPDEAIVATLSQQLSWSHFVELIKLDDPTQRSFYTDLSTQSPRRLPARCRPHSRHDHARQQRPGVPGGPARRGPHARTR